MVSTTSASLRGKGTREDKIKGDLVHFEIAADDADKLAAFYAKVLGWKIADAVPELGDYRIIRTGGGEDAVGGGLYPRSNPGQQGLNYYDVESIEDTVALIEELGGQVIMEKMAVPKMGWMAVVLDPEGNGFGLWIMDENAA